VGARGTSVFEQLWSSRDRRQATLFVCEKGLASWKAMSGDFNAPSTLNDCNQRKVKRPVGESTE